VGAGWHASVEAAADQCVRITPLAQPGRDVAAYADAHRRYRALYPALAPSFHDA
jgi:hypothetical protein